MPKSKNRKDHKKKVSQRNTKIKQEKDRFQKYQKEMIMKYIEEEKKKGLFDNTQQVPTDPQISDGPLI